MVLRLRVLLAGGSSARRDGRHGRQEPVAYRLSFPERAHRLMDVEITFSDVPPGPLELRMSRSSPGRYALHEFAKNVFDVRVTDATGRPLVVTRPDPQQWDVTDTRGSVRVTYRVFGDRVDGTYLGIDSTHAHINMPAALMWARGLELRPVTIRFEPPTGTSWRVATQLLPGSDQFTFTAPEPAVPDGQSDRSSARSRLRTFTVADDGRTPTFRLAVHHDGSDAELDAFVARRRADRPRGAPRVRRVSRLSKATPTRSSPTTCRGRAATAWSIATAPS